MGNEMQNVQQSIETNNNIKTENIQMNKKLIRLTESDLHRIVKESVNRLLNEWEYAGWVNDIGDDYYDEPNDPNEKNERNINNAWDEFDRNISNRREMNDRRSRFYHDLHYNPDNVQTSSTRNGENLNGRLAMLHPIQGKSGVEKSKFDFSDYATKNGRDKFLSKKAPNQDY